MVLSHAENLWTNPAKWICKKSRENSNKFGTMNSFDSPVVKGELVSFFANSILCNSHALTLSLI